MCWFVHCPGQCMEVKMKQILQVVCLGLLLVVFLQGKEFLCALPKFAPTRSSRRQSGI